MNTPFPAPFRRKGQGSLVISRLIFNGLGGDWAGYTPALPGSGITATFDCAGTSFAYEGIPFDGDALPSYMSNGLANGALLGALMLAKQK